MTRNTAPLSPTALKLKNRIGSFGEVLSYTDAPQPILSPSIRSAVHQWMTELRAEDELDLIGVKPRRSALLSGPPGCGKTTLAHHLAARLGIDLVCVDTERLVSAYLGETGRNIAEFFEKASEAESEFILFFDEFDSIGSKRADSPKSGASSERNAIVASLLTRIEHYPGIMMAATNRADSIDPAIWRRFGIQMEIPIPGEDERYAILQMYLDPFQLEDALMDFLTEAIEGAAPSLIRQLVEGIKRDMVLAPKINLEQGLCHSVERVVASVKPHGDYELPPLWHNPAGMLSAFKDHPWPLTRK